MLLGDESHFGIDTPYSTGHEVSAGEHEEALEVLGEAKRAVQKAPGGDP